MSKFTVILRPALRIITMLVASVGLITPINVMAKSPSAISLWWDFVVQIDSTFGATKPEQGKGIVLGKVDGLKSGLLVVTANHVVRSRAGVPAKSITVRLPWDTTAVRQARVTGLFEPSADVAVIFVPLRGKFDDIFGALVMGCDSSLKPGDLLRIGDLSTYDLHTQPGSFKGFDAQGNLLMTGIPAIRGQSGAPVINKNGAVVGILTQSEGSAKTSFAAPISLIERLYREQRAFKGGGHTQISLDKNLNPLSAEEVYRRYEKIECEIHQNRCDDYHEWLDYCSKKQTEQSIDECMGASRLTSQACESSTGAFCRSLLSQPLRESEYELNWNTIPSCECIDARVGGRSGDELRGGALTCSQSNLLDAVIEELEKGGFRLAAGLIERFPATREDFQRIFTDEPFDVVWKSYENFRSTAARFPESSSDYHEATVEEQALVATSIRPIGYPVCERIPSHLAPYAARRMTKWIQWLRGTSHEKVTKVRTGMTICQVPIQLLDSDPRDFPSAIFLQLGEKWIFFFLNI